MHTLRLTMIGVVLLSVFVFVTAQINQRKNKRTVDGAWIFIWLWLAVAAINFCVGVFIAGYSVTTEIEEAFHVLFAADLEGQNVRIVTAYYPSGEEWEADLKTRRRSL